MIRATEADRAEIEAFLMPRAEFAMFPLNNLAHHGMAGVRGVQAALTLHGVIKTLDHDKPHFLLMDGDIPLTMTGFNPRLPDIVQIGGVYTPPAWRGRGLARRALALHLAQVQATGVQRSTLFAVSAVAARACRALGFREIGAWSLIVLAEKALAHG